MTVWLLTTYIFLSKFPLKIASRPLGKRLESLCISRIHHLGVKLTFVSVNEMDCDRTRHFEGGSLAIPRYTQGSVVRKPDRLLSTKLQIIQPMKNWLWSPISNIIYQFSIIFPCENWWFSIVKTNDFLFWKQMIFSCGKERFSLVKMDDFLLWKWMIFSCKNRISTEHLRSVCRVCSKFCWYSIWPFFQGLK